MPKHVKNSTNILLVEHSWRVELIIHTSTQGDMNTPTQGM